MAVLNSIAADAEVMQGWRQHIHRNPELGLDCAATAGFVVDRLRDFGITEITEGVGKTGVVALIRGRGEGPVIGLRADMDALPISEATGAGHASETPGRMHACGHDGHTTMLLGAAKYLAETRNFAGTVALIFQPGEEGAGGAQGDGRRRADRAVRHRPGLRPAHRPLGAARALSTTARRRCWPRSTYSTIRITGRGGHGAYPETDRRPGRRRAADRPGAADHRRPQRAGPRPGGDLGDDDRGRHRLQHRARRPRCSAAPCAPIRLRCAGPDRAADAARSAPASAPRWG